jgi:hypothetical protein
MTVMSPTQYFYRMVGDSGFTKVTARHVLVCLGAMDVRDNIPHLVLCAVTTPICMIRRRELVEMDAADEWISVKTARFPCIPVMKQKLEGAHGMEETSGERQEKPARVFGFVEIAIIARISVV